MENILKATNIVKKYGDHVVLDNVCMNINKGDIYGFIGKNGAGKTTFMRVALELTEKDSGDLYYYDNKSIKEVGLKIGSLIEAPGLFKNENAYENLKRYCLLYGCDTSKNQELLDLVGLGDVGKRPVKNFSLGMRQRLGIAISLLNDPELLILDEPINGLDPEGIKLIRDLILKLNKERGITFLISSHLLDELAKVVTKYGIINDGKLIEEISAQDLQDKCKNKLIIETDNPSKTVEILKDILANDEIKIIDNKVEITSHIEESGMINKKLVDNGVIVNAIYPNLDSLEEYFMRKIGD